MLSALATFVMPINSLKLKKPEGEKESGEQKGARRVREGGAQTTAGKRSCPKLSSELKGRDVMDAKQLSSRRREGTGMHRPSPDPQSHHLCSLPPLKLYTHGNISGNLPMGTWPRTPTCAHVHTCMTISEMMKEKNCKRDLPGPWGNMSVTPNTFKRSGDSVWLTELSHWTEPDPFPPAQACLMLHSASVFRVFQS